MAFEAQREANSYAASRVKAELGHDISAVFAASALMIILLYLGQGTLMLLEWLAEPAADAFSYLLSLDRTDVLAQYRDFLRSDVFLAALEFTCYAVSLLLPFLLIKRFARQKPKRFFPFNARMPENPVMFFAFASGVTLAVNFVCALLFERFYPVVGQSPSGGPAYRIVSVVMIVLIAPLGEELFFRGAVYGVLSRYSQSMAVFVSALVFGLAHRNPPQVINAFVMGIFLAVAYAGTGSVAACVFIHALNNAFSVIVQYSQGYRLYYLLVPAIGLFVLALGAFTAVRIVMAAFRRRRAVAVFDDEATDVPRIGRRAYAAAFCRNPFVWIFAALIAAGVWVLYI